MASNLAIGAGFSAFVSLLVPPYVTEVTGNAADAGIVMAVISLAAVLGPVLGTFADKYHAHRLVMSLGVLGMSVAFAMYAFSAEVTGLYALDAIAMGVSIAAISAVSPVFIVGARLPKPLEAKRLTAFNLMSPIGQVIGGAIIGAATAAGWSYNLRFLLAAGIIFLCFLATWFGSSKPAARIRVETKEPEQEGGGEKKSTGLGGVLISVFGAYLLVLALSSVCSNGINNQISNILPQVYGIDAVTTSGLISLAGLLNIGLFIAAGWLMGRYSALSVLTLGHLMRIIGSLGMALLGTVTESSVLLAAASMQLLYQGAPLVRLTQPVVAVRFATVAAGAASGWVIAASAVGSFIGSLIGGFLADAVGFNAINWMAAVAAVVGAAVLFLVVWPAKRRKQADEASKTGGQ